MRLLIAGVAASMLAVRADSQTPPAALPPVATREIKNIVPAAASVEQFVISPDSARTYYRLNTGGIWMYDRTNAPTKILDGVVWDLALSPKKDGLAFTKVGDNPREQHVWVLPLSPATGLAAGRERKVSTRTGDVPTISPDGKQVAFARDDETGVGQTVVVVPITGGTERAIAASQPSGVSNIRWAPDGKKVYFGVNPPVPFTCAESCLTGARESRPSSTIRRVGASGGSVETLATVGAPGPGLSPDGKYMVFGDSGSPRRLIIADADGKRLKSFSIATPQVPVGWMGSSTLLTLASGQMRRLKAVSLPDGATRVLHESNDFIFTPSWAPDGRSISMIRFGNGCELNVRNADGTAQRVIPLTKTGGCGNIAWTADQRTVVFTNYRGPSEKNILTAVDATTGMSKPLRTLADDNSQWILDRDVVVLLENVGSASTSSPLMSTPVRNVNSTRRAAWQVDLSGEAKLLREIPVESGTTVNLVDRNRVIVGRTASREIRVMTLSNGEEKTIGSMGPGGSPSRVFFSGDREWIGYLTGADITQLTKLEVVKLDGTTKRTVTLPFAADPNGMRILPGGTGVVIGERGQPGQPMNVYFMSESAAATKLFVGQAGEFALSPDGRTLLYLVNELIPPVISAIDITTIK